MPVADGDGTNRLVYWILGALITLVGFISGVAHNMMMTQLDSIENRIERLEDVRLRGE